VNEIIELDWEVLELQDKQNNSTELPQNNRQWVDWVELSKYWLWVRTTIMK